MRCLYSALLVCSLVSTAAAQVGRGEAIVSQFANLAPMEGLLKVNRNGTATPVTGLALTARASNDINSIQLDPVNNRIWIGGITASAGRLDSFEVSAANAVVNFAANGNIGTGGSIAAITFDDNGNPILASGTISTVGTGGIFKVDRKTSTVTRIVGGATWPGLAGTANAISRDATGNLYLGVAGSAQIWRIPADANGNYTVAPVLLGTSTPTSPQTTISAVEYAPAAGTRPARVWWTTFGAAGQAVGYLPATGGASTAVGTIGGNNAPNWIDYDELVGDFWITTGGINPDEIYRMDHAGVHALIAQVPPAGANGSPSASDANDCPAGEVNIVPNFMAIPTATFDLEMGTCCVPGEVAAVALVSPAFLLISNGIVGTDGRIHVKIPNLTLAAGTPGILTFQAACINRVGPVLRLGAPKRWPRN